MERFNVFKRRDGRWEARIYDVFGKGSQKIKKYFYARTKESCENRAIAYMKNDSVKAAPDYTFRTICDEWMQQTLHRVKASTRANYEMKLRIHIRPYFDDFHLKSISQDVIYDFIHNKTACSLSTRYISDIIILLKNIFKYAARTYSFSNPCVGIILPKCTPCKVRLLDGEEQKKLRKYLAKSPNPTSLGVSLCMATGIRIGELCALQWKDIDLEKRILSVSKTLQRIQCPTDTASTQLTVTEPKSASSNRVIPLPKSILPLLKKFQGAGENYVLSGISKPVEPRTMQYRFQRILKNANLPSIHFHALRHMFATNCIRLGFDVKILSEILGHSKIEITLNRYVHPSFEQKQEYMDRVRIR